MIGGNVKVIRPNVEWGTNESAQTKLTRRWTEVS